VPHPADEHTGVRIARHRKQRGLTQQGLAMRANVSKSLLSKVECGQKPASQALIAACARALSVTPADILGQPYAEELRDDRMDALLQPIRIGMENWDVPHDWETRPRPVPLIRADIDGVLLLRRQANLMDMAQLLPALIDESVHAAHTSHMVKSKGRHTNVWPGRSAACSPWPGASDIPTWPP
jgi:transcriptional regulator with XRE-family HTH domain